MIALFLARIFKNVSPAPIRAVEVSTVFRTLFATLVFSMTSFAQSVSLALSSGSGYAGAAVSLNLTLSGGASPAGLQWTTGYVAADISSVTVTDGPAATAAGKSATCAGSAGVYTCVLVGVNGNVIADGVVAVVQVTIASGAVFASTAVPLSGVVAASLGGDAIAASSSGGTVTRLASAATPPAPVSVTPSSGSGVTQTFTFLYSDANGYSDIRWVEMALGAALTSTGSCYLHYDRTFNLIYLANDSGSDWVGAVALGSGGVVQNSQCAVDAGASSGSGSGLQFTVNLIVAFRSSFWPTIPARPGPGRVPSARQARCKTASARSTWRRRRRPAPAASSW
ncbi:MAG: hypothetical protein HY013_20770 [Candidatus Solibacter usitatus]|nr:hypothetical protein [Candidatus Solibacter usitatus]